MLNPRVCLQVGEFAFVMLSLATQLGLIPARLSMLLLGVTAISLLTTPLVFTLAHHVLPRETAGLLPLASPGPKRLTSMPPNSAFAANDAVGPRSAGPSSGPASGSGGGVHLRPRQSSGIAERDDASEREALSPWVGVDAGDGDADSAHKARRSPCALPVSHGLGLGASGARRSRDGGAATSGRHARAEACVGDAQPHLSECVHRGAGAGGGSGGVGLEGSSVQPSSRWHWWAARPDSTGDAGDGAGDRGRQGSAALDTRAHGSGSFG